MANGFGKALNQLAGIAGQEIEKSRRFRINLVQQAAAMDRQKEQFDREMKVDEAKLKIAENQLKLAQDRLKFESSGELAEQDEKIRGLESRIAEMNTIDKISKERQKLSEAQFGAAAEAMDDLIKMQGAGFPEDALDEQQRLVSHLAGLATGQEFFTENIDHTAGRPQGVTPENPPPIEPGKNFRATLDLRKQFNAETKTFQEVERQVGNIEVAANRMLNMSPDEFNRIGIDQAVITSFNKILDPESVVRESEYERTPANESIVRRARGFIEQLKGGGSGITQESVLELRDTAREMARIRRDIANKKGEAVRSIGSKRGLNPDEIGLPFKPFAFETQGQGGTTFQSAFSGATDSSQVPQPTFDINKHRQKHGL